MGASSCSGKHHCNQCGGSVDVSDRKRSLKEYEPQDEREAHSELPEPTLPLSGKCDSGLTDLGKKDCALVPPTPRASNGNAAERPFNGLAQDEQPPTSAEAAVAKQADDCYTNGHQNRCENPVDCGGANSAGAAGVRENGVSRDGQGCFTARGGATQPMWPSQGILDPSSGNQVVTYEDGSIYTGQVVDMKRHGCGLWQSRTGKYEGQWQDDAQHGSGRQTWSDGRTYAGEFKAGRFSGNGCMVWRTQQGQLYYEGQYREDLKHGTGKFVWPDGRLYHGEWLGGKRHGRGVFMNTQAESRVGYWLADKFQNWEDEVPVGKEPSNQQEPSAEGGPSAAGGSE
eukprot:TRINITY_DN31336_c0_g1_i1.p1 TRINITY_DN31336_c0_g1~~TRINITY_DN31336_c0_g1_i1.p1  ORF type:complete len:341 (-),score=65.84 TRINITY_DN31336_c0_g1_i1:61-1083(-)